jgi:hypothetical protein
MIGFVRSRPRVGQWLALAVRCLLVVAATVGSVASAAVVEHPPAPSVAVPTAQAPPNSPVEADNAESRPPVEREFLDDVRRLTSNPHRLSGTAEGRAAADYVISRLRANGVAEVLPLDMPVWTPNVRRCTLELGGHSLRLWPMRANVTVQPNTGTDGIVGPVVYVGPGSARDFAERKVTGAIVVVDYDSYAAWSHAFAFGARAVIFLDRGRPASVEPKWAGVPSNLPRFYLPAPTTVDLTRDHASAKLTSEILWEPAIGRNVIARVAGSSPAFASDRGENEAIVMATALDSFGEVPTLAEGARGAANVAALLAAAKAFVADPPRRDSWLVFVDNQAHAHQGAREFYDAITMSESQHHQLLLQHRSEQSQLTALRSLVEKEGLTVSRQHLASTLLVVFSNAVTQEASYARDDARKQAELGRLRAAASQRDAQQSESARELVRHHEAIALHWDEIRRAWHLDALSAFVKDKTHLLANGGADAPAAKQQLALIEMLRVAVISRCDRRLLELSRLSTIDEQRDKLRALLRDNAGSSRKMPWVVLHVGFDFGDVGPTWGVIAGDWTNRLFPWRAEKSDADSPGYYGRVYNALAEVTHALPGLVRLDRSTLTDPSLGTTFAPGAFFSSGTVAGSYGFYNVSLMTGHDRRSRDGYPHDTLSNLDWSKLRAQAAEATTLLLAASNSPDLSLSSVFKSVARSKYPTFEQGQNSGDYVGLQVSGSLKEDRPAAGALLAIWPGNVDWGTQAFSSLAKALDPPAFDPMALEVVEQTGQFRVVGLRDDMHSAIMTLGTVQAEDGRVLAITTGERQAQRLTDSMRVNLFFGQGFAFSAASGLETRPELLKLLDASSDAPFRENRALYGQLDEHGFAYVSDQVKNQRYKLFQPMGVTVLGKPTQGSPNGSGFETSQLTNGIAFSQRTAEDIWRLNEQRLDQLRARGVTSADLERLHSRARRAMQQAEASPNTVERDSAYLRSASLSHHVYLPLRRAMDDLVHAIVVLLLLAIPFAFAVERLTVCATTIYGRIAGFGSAFLATFALLYWMHPGFAIASTPTLIFLAFAIVLLSSVVIVIVIRKFKTELRAMHGQATSLHGVEVSRMGTLLAAVGMGMSTMRRRRTRTTLTAITVVMLTFTILSFASFSRTVGVRATYQGPPSERVRAKVLLHKLDFSEIRPSTLDLLRGQEGTGGLVAPQYWLTRELNAKERIGVTAISGRSTLTVDAIIGISAAEFGRWPELSEAFGSDPQRVVAAIAAGQVFLPRIIQSVLGLAPGQMVLLNGKPVLFADAIDASALERLRHLDGHPVLPVDLQDPAAAGSQTNSNAQKDETKLILGDEVELNPTNLSSDQVAVASDVLVRELGGKLRTIAIYAPDSVDAAERGRRIAELVVMPVWAAGTDGVERLVFTVLTEVAGGFGLFIPLLLGGLIIFGTLLGSISDREREIYTFSALGLAPGHVGALFFAEAAVYAVIGGMGGQLLAQFVGQAAAYSAKRGWIAPVSINYSSTNSLFAIGVVMLTVLVSAVYPAYRASKSANPGLARSWKLPLPVGDCLELVFPFTVSAYDIVGVMSFLAEHFRQHSDAGLGEFASTRTAIVRTTQGHLQLTADVALAPFDLGVTEQLELSAVASEIPGVDEVSIHITRYSGTRGDWIRANHVFLKGLRRQFLLWRTLSSDVIEDYRRRTRLELDATVAPVIEVAQ